MPSNNYFPPRTHHQHQQVSFGQSHHHFGQYQEQQYHQQNQYNHHHYVNMPSDSRTASGPQRSDTAMTEPPLTEEEMNVLNQEIGQPSDRFVIFIL